MTEQAPPKEPLVLLVEDNLADQEMVRRSFGQAAGRVQLEVVDDGEQALDYLLHRDLYEEPSSSPAPDLILLDLNLPRLNGRELLSQVRSSEQLRHLPIIVLTTSQSEDDVLESYRLGANAFITKPARFDLYLAVVEQICTHWMSTVRLPPKAS